MQKCVKMCIDFFTGWYIFFATEENIKMTEKRYMHLMNDKPALFDKEEDYMFFADKIFFDKLPKSLYQIRKEQKIMKKIDSVNREEYRYSYMIVRLK